MNREDMLANLTSTLEAWYCEHTGGEPQANIISAGIIVLHHMQRTFPLIDDDYITPGGQVSQIGRVPRILEEFGETRRWPAEAGRTSRGTRPRAEDLVRRLQSAPAARFLSQLPDEERREVIRTLQEWMVARAREYLDRQRLEVEINLTKPPSDIVRDILAAGERIGKAGAVAHHLVGAKLALRYPHYEVTNRSHTTADQHGGHAGDYVINDTAFHVTVAPMLHLFQNRVAENLRNGLRVKVLVPKNRVEGARQMAEQAGVAGRVDIAAIEDFIGPNIEEIAEFSSQGLARYFRELLETYNSRVEAVEADRSFLFDVPANLGQ